jgi:hypothetical protein
MPAAFSMPQIAPRHKNFQDRRFANRGSSEKRFAPNPCLTPVSGPVPACCLQKIFVLFSKKFGAEKKNRKRFFWTKRSRIP